MHALLISVGSQAFALLAAGSKSCWATLDHGQWLRIERERVVVV